jgi:hypothetical protein
VRSATPYASSMDPFVVELTEWTQRIATPTRGSLKWRAVASLAFGGVLALLAAAGLVVTLVQDGISARLLGVAFVGGFGAILMWNGTRFMRHLPPGADGDRVQFSAPFAFAISDDAIHFPGRFGADPEDWPLAETMVEAAPGRSGRSLALRCPGKKPRRFIARALVMSPGEISRLVEDRRGVPRA